MRHPLLRVLVALLIGVWSPLCCCKAMALARTACGTALTAGAVTDACCPDNNEEPPPRDGSVPSEHGGSLPGDCPSCPSCRGTSSSVGLKADAKLPTLEQQSNVLATIALAMRLDLPRPDGAGVPALAAGRRSPPHVRANRDAQRWHCALTI